MGNKVVKPRDNIHNFIDAQFLRGKVLDSSIRYYLVRPDLHKEILYLRENTIQQINRVDKEFDKKDLVSIMMKLDSKNMSRYHNHSNNYSVKDLRYMIRKEVYKNSIKDVLKN
jgi:hypothetical protein